MKIDSSNDKVKYSNEISTGDEIMSGENGKQKGSERKKKSNCQNVTKWHQKSRTEKEKKKH